IAVRMVPALAVSFAAIAIVGLFAFPAVRASAQAMLDLFRVRKFSAISYDATRIEKLRALAKQTGNETMMVFEKTDTVKEPGAPQYCPDPMSAGAAAGLNGVRRVFGALPNGMLPDSVFVQGAGEAHMQVSEARLRAMLDALDLQDVSVPMGLDGKQVDVK